MFLAVLWKWSICTKKRMASKGYFRYTSMSYSSSTSCRNTNNYPFLSYSNRTLSSRTPSRQAQILLPCSDGDCEQKERKDEVSAVSSPTHRMLISLTFDIYYIFLYLCDKDGPESTEENVLKVTLLQQCPVLGAAQLRRIQFLHFLGQLLETCVFLQGTIIDIIRSLVCLLLVFKFFIFVLDYLQLVLPLLTDLPTVIHCKACRYRRYFIIAFEYFEEGDELSSENVTKAIFLLNWQEGQHSVYCGKILFVVVVSHSRLTHHLFIILYLLFLQLNLCLCCLYLFLLLGQHSRYLFLFDLLLFFYLYLLLWGRFCYLLLLHYFGSMSNSWFRFDLWRRFLIDGLALNKKGSIVFRKFLLWDGSGHLLACH